MAAPSYALQGWVRFRLGSNWLPQRMASARRAWQHRRGRWGHPVPHSHGTRNLCRVCAVLRRALALAGALKHRCYSHSIDLPWVSARAGSHDWRRRGGAVGAPLPRTGCGAPTAALVRGLGGCSIPRMGGSVARRWSAAPTKRMGDLRVSVGDLDCCSRSQPSSGPASPLKQAHAPGYRCR